MAENTKPVEIQLAVLDSKLDGIRTTLDVRLNHIEERITENAAEIKAVERHAEAGRLQLDDAFNKLLATKTDKIQSEERYSNITDRMTKVEGHLTWTVRLVIGAVILAVLAGGYLVSKAVHVPANPPAISQAR